MKFAFLFVLILPLNFLQGDFLTDSTLDVNQVESNLTEELTDFDCTGLMDFSELGEEAPCLNCAEYHVICPCGYELYTQYCDDCHLYNPYVTLQLWAAFLCQQAVDDGKC
ncbi:MAG: hypothetical protein AAFO07_22470 [Bacteroidota bacterium]